MLRISGGHKLSKRGEDEMRVFLIFAILLFSAPLMGEEIFYDDGSAEDTFWPGMTNWEAAEWFTPTAYPCTLFAVKFYPMNTYPLHWKVWDDDGVDPLTGGIDPGTVLSSGVAYPAAAGEWLIVELPTPVVFNDGEFFIGWTQTNSDTLSSYGNGFDSSPPHSNRAIYHCEILGSWYWILLWDPEYEIGTQGDIMIRAIVSSGSIKIEEKQHPRQFELSAFPNPFNSSVKILYTLPPDLSEQPHLEIFDICGKKIVKLPLNGVEGRHTVIWNPSLPSGVYFVRIQAGRLSKTQKLVLLR